MTDASNGTTRRPPAFRPGPWPMRDGQTMHIYEVGTWGADHGIRIHGRLPHGTLGEWSGDGRWLSRGRGNGALFARENPCDLLPPEPERIDRVVWAVVHPSGFVDTIFGLEPEKAPPYNTRYVRCRLVEIVESSDAE